MIFDALLNAANSVSLPTWSRRRDRRGGGLNKPPTDGGKSRGTAGRGFNIMSKENFRDLMGIFYLETVKKIQIFTILMQKKKIVK